MTPHDLNHETANESKEEVIETVDQTLNSQGLTSEEQLTTVKDDTAVNAFVEDTAESSEDNRAGENKKNIIALCLLFSFLATIAFLISSLSLIRFGIGVFIATFIGFTTLIVSMVIFILGKDINQKKKICYSVFYILILIILSVVTLVVSWCFAPEIYIYKENAFYDKFYWEYGKQFHRSDLPEIVEKEGYVVSWYKDAERTEAANLGFSIRKNLTLYAYWEIIQFDVVINSKSEKIKLSKIDYGDIIEEPPIPQQREGFEFLGWGSPNYFFGSAVKADVYIEAEWKENDDNESPIYIISFITYGGTQIESIPIESGGNIPKRPLDPERNGYIFDDWYSDIGSHERFEFKGTVTDDITIYAKWRIDPLIESLPNADAGTGSSTTTSSGVASGAPPNAAPNVTPGAPSVPPGAPPDEPPVPVDIFLSMEPHESEPIKDLLSEYCENCKWKSENTKLVDVDPEGTITAYRSGKTEITVSCANGHSAVIYITVR